MHQKKKASTHDLWEKVIKATSILKKLLQGRRAEWKTWCREQIIAIVYCMVLLLRTLTSSTRCKMQQSNWCAHCQDINITLSFICLHWLPIKFRIIFKIAMLCFKCIHRHVPDHLKSMVLLRRPPLKHQCPVGRLFTMIKNKHLAIEPFPIHPPRFGTVSPIH